jgi:hypothetical protein
MMNDVSCVMYVVWEKGELDKRPIVIKIAEQCIM